MMSFAPIIILLIYLVIIMFIVYFLLKVLQFMKTKSENDRLLIQKVEELSQKLNEMKRM